MYTSRKDNGRADALSRRSDIIEEKEITKVKILRLNEDRSLGLSKGLNRLARKNLY